MQTHNFFIQVPQPRGPSLCTARVTSQQFSTDQENRKKRTVVSGMQQYPYGSTILHCGTVALVKLERFTGKHAYQLDSESELEVDLLPQATAILLAKVVKAMASAWTGPRGAP